MIFFLLIFSGFVHISVANNNKNEKKSLWIDYLCSSILLNNGSLRSHLFNHLSALETYLSEHGANDWRRFAILSYFVYTSNINVNLLVVEV